MERRTMGGLTVLGVCVVAGTHACGGAANALGAPCTTNAECVESYVCGYGQCRLPCAVDADCRTSECLLSSTGEAVGVCRLPTEESGAPGGGGAGGSTGLGGSGGFVFAGGAGVGGVVYGGGAGVGGITAGAGGVIVVVGGGWTGSGGAVSSKGGAAGVGGIIASKGGAAGTGGITAGAGGTTMVDTCVGKTPQRPLPYVVATDFYNPQTVPDVANPADTTWVRITNPDCYGNLPTGIPAEFPVWYDGGLPDGADAAVDAGKDAVSDVASVDAPRPIPACWGFYYNPDRCAAGAATMCWAGVVFESVLASESVAVTLPGVCIAAGATTLEFEARASRNGAAIKFGSTRPGVGISEQWFDIDSVWRRYMISIPPDYRYNSSTAYGVAIGFSAIVEPQDHPGGTHIQVRNMTWVRYFGAE